MSFRKVCLLGIPLVLLAAAAFGFQRAGLFDLSDVLSFGGEGRLTLDPAEIDFGPVTLGTGSRVIQVLAINDGDELLSVESVSAEAPFLPEMDPFELEPGDARFFSVRVLPKQAGEINGTLTVETSEGGHKASLRALAQLPPRISIEPASLSFGAVQLLETATGVITISNHGQGDLEINATSPSVFKSHLADKRIPAGGKTTLTVVFSPAEATEYMMSFTVVANDPEHEKTVVGLSGSGVEDPLNPIASASPAQLDFGKVPVGSTETRWISVSNSGTDPLTINSTRIPAPYSTSIQGRIIAAGETLGFPISYAPTNDQTHSGTLSILSNDSVRGPLAVSLTGEGYPGTAEQLAATGYQAPTEGSTNPTKSILERLALYGGSSEDTLMTDESLGDADETVAAHRSILDGSQITYGAYYAKIDDFHIDNVRFGEATIEFEGVNFPIVSGAIGSYWEFDPTSAIGTVSDNGDIGNMTMSLTGVDRGNYPLAVNIEFTTGTTHYQIGDGQWKTMTGSAINERGIYTVVGSGMMTQGALKGEWVRVKINGNVNTGEIVVVSDGGE
ncbi:MAG: choice-of-anchor D domain-containing protein [bacterium]|nr:choice-of-anchor D domain-containing protein [bacterium]